LQNSTIALPPCWFFPSPFFFFFFPLIVRKNRKYLMLRFSTPLSPLSFPLFFPFSVKRLISRICAEAMPFSFFTSCFSIASFTLFPPFSPPSLPFFASIAESASWLGACVLPPRLSQVLPISLFLSFSFPFFFPPPSFFPPQGEGEPANKARHSGNCV